MKARGQFFEASMNQLEQMTGFSYRTIISKLKRGNCKPLRKEGNAYVYDTPAALKSIYFSPKGQVSDPEHEKLLDYTQERAKMVRQQRKKIKVERLRLEKTLVDTTEIKIAYKNLVFNFRAKMLAIPPKLAGKITKVKSIVAAQKMIHKEIETALIELVLEEDPLDDIEGNE